MKFKEIVKRISPYKTHIFSFFAYYKYAIIAAIIVGFIAFVPQVMVKNAMGNEDRGIPYLVHDSEGEYLGRINEILDGYPSVSSPVMYEYKNAVSLMPPVSEWIFYVLPMKITGLSLSYIIYLSRFLFPAILFFFAFLLIFSLLNKKDTYAQVSAIGGALLMTIGYDIADYRGIYSYITHGLDYSNHVGLIWDRLVNPVTGAMLLFVFLFMFIRFIYKRDRYLSIIVSSVVLSLMSGYIFSFAIGLTVSVLFAIYFVWKKDWVMMRNASLPLIAAVVINGSYILKAFLTMNGGDVLSDPRKQGLFFTHVPTINIISIATFIIVILCIIYLSKRDRDGKTDNRWQIISIIIIISCLLVYSQQIITGRTVWPQHFVQYTTLLCMAILTVFLHNLLRNRARYLWFSAMLFMFLISAVCGYRIISTVPNVVPQYAELQSFSGVFDYLNKNAKKDCVVYVSSDYGNEINRFISAFTSCNVYYSFYIYNGVPYDRVVHNFLVNLRLKGIAVNDVKKHFNDNSFWTRAYFFRDWNDMFCCSDRWLKKIGNEQEINNYFDNVEKDIEGKYSEYLKHDLYSELSRYKLDYFVVDTEKQPNVNEKNYDFLSFKTMVGKFAVYEFVKPGTR